MADDLVGVNSVGEIRVGPAHQARLPDCKLDVSPREMPEKCESLEELRWMPGLEECDLKMYLRAARSMAAFAGMCDGGSAEDGCLAASRDDTTINALQLLHESNYDTGKALQALVKSPVPKGIEKKWTEEEQKRFVKGLRLYGKNFFKIRKELLSHKETPDLVEYYYLWKKTPQAASARPHRRHRRCVLRRIRTANNNNSNPNVQKSSNKEDASSASEDEAEQTDDSDSHLNSDLSCTNCGTVAKELLQTGKDRSLLCNECRNYLKKFGEHRPIRDKDSNQIKSSIKMEDEANFNLSNGKPNLRVRRNKGDKNSKFDLNRGNSKSSENSSPERADQNLTENETNGDSGENVSTTDTKKSENILKKRHFSNVSNEFNGCDGETANNEFSDNNENKRKKFMDDDDDDGLDSDQSKPDDNSTINEDVNKIIEKIKDSSSPSPSNNEVDDKEVPSAKTEADEVSMESSAEITAKLDALFEAKNNEDNKDEKKSLDLSDQASNFKAANSTIKEDSCEADSKESSNEKEPNNDGKAPNVNSVKIEPPYSPQDLSSLSSRDKILQQENNNVPFPTSAISTTSSPSSSTPPMVKKEDNSAVNYSGSNLSNIGNPPASVNTNKASPSISPTNPSVSTAPPFPFPPLHPIPPLPPGADARQFPYLVNFSSQDPGLKPTVPDKPETEAKAREEKTSKNSSAASKNENGRGLPSPRTTSSAPTFPSLVPPFMTSPNETFMLPHPNFAAALPPGSDRLPFPNPLMNYQGFAPLPFMPPWPQYARLPQGTFPSSFLPPPGAGQMGAPAAHSPHSQMSKSKSPITSSAQQSSSSHHGSVPSHKSHTEKEQQFVGRDFYQPPDEDDFDSSYLHRGPSPEPKIEDSECHRSQSAIFLKHWNRGEFNSCARTDLTFKPAPDSQLFRRREERARKAAEKEREEHKKSSEKSEIKSNHGLNPPGLENTHMTSMGGRRTPRNFESPSIRDYGRPHTAYSPFSHPSLAHHMSSNLPPLGLHSGAGPSAPIDQMAITQMMIKERMEAEEKQKLAMLDKQKEMELKSRSQSQPPQHNVPPMPSTSTAPPGLFDQHILDMQRRLAQSSASSLPNSSMSNNPNTSTANALSLAGSNPALNPFMIFSQNERAVQEIQQMAAAADAARFQDRLGGLSADHLLRLQMGINPDLHAASPGGPGAGFQHPSLHPSGNSNAAAAEALQLANAAAMGLPGAQFDPALHGSHPLFQTAAAAAAAAYPSRPTSIIPRSELTQPPLYRSLEDQLSAQALSAQTQLQHEQFQRQIMMERDRLLAQQHHQQQILQEEFFRREAANRRQM